MFATCVRKIFHPGELDIKFTAVFHRWIPHSCVRNARSPSAWDTRLQSGSSHLINVKNATKFFYSKTSLKYHSYEHSNAWPYQCKQCGIGFGTRYLLKRHMVKHSDERPNRCDICQLSSKFKTVLSTHMNIHDEQNPFRCEQSNKSCVSKSDLEIHMIKHSDLRPPNVIFAIRTSNIKNALLLT
ncbi:hypothetical protein AVEN_71249-1 [Araneus ventricosus]|uniref:C2H2-type domain-containing protein n=1 Tax=Araneus ventricosus TaxID=182803 RepID=A0A4Y2VSU8_ARAVE|nr:hypothetical protein AVEN_71249-1 [Araneus ventricosus]